MGQLGFFDLNRRYESLDEKNDTLVAIAAMELKAALIKGELRTSDATRKSLAGRKPWDEVMIFIGVDRRDKFVRRYVVSDASVHDSQKFEDVLDASNTASDVWADSAYRSAEIEEKLAA